MNRLLVAAYEFPPKGGTQSQHVAKLAKALAECGWGVTALTVADPPTSMRDEALQRELEGKVRTVFAWSLEPTRAIQALRRARAPKAAAAPRAPQAAQPQAPSGGARGYTSLPRWAIRAIQAFFIPDEKIGWLPYALRAADEERTERGAFDVVLASGPPYTVFSVGRRISRRQGVPWVADLRDPIYGSYFFTPHTPIHAWLMRRFERRTVTSASRVIVATEGIREGILSRIPQAASKVVVVPNGFDPDDYAGPPPSPHAGMVFAYVGAFQGSANPDLFLAAFDEARREDPGFARDARVRFVGPRDAATDRMVDSRGLDEVVERTGFVSHAEAIEAMREADVLLQVMGFDPGLKLALSSKLPEYLGAGRTVLSIVPDGVAADVVRRSRGGVVVAPTGVEPVKEALLELYARWCRGELPEPDPAVVAEFDRRRIAERVGRMLEEVAAKDA